MFEPVAAVATIAAAVSVADGGEGNGIGGVLWSDTAVLNKKKPPHIAFASERGWWCVIIDLSVIH
jgi:hypothetical protein